jgi:Raf kinase inhibitor-like YbhB/YbcL family protein
VPRPLPALAVTCSLLLIVAACDTNDGRDLRPADPDQSESISVPSAPPSSTLPPGESLGGLGGLGVTTDPPSTLPGSVTDGDAVGAPWADGTAIDERYTCDGDDVSPSLSWPDAPEGTGEIGVALVDDDAPDFVHWAMAGIDPFRVSMAENEVPPGAIQATNGNGDLGYAGPCPPAGALHTYRVIVFYLADPIDLPDGSDGAAMLEALTASSFQSAFVTGVYSRAGA